MLPWYPFYFLKYWIGVLQRVLNPDPIKDEAKENRLTLFKAHTQNMTPYPREKQKLRIA